MNIVMALPMVASATLPAVRADKTWQPGTLSRVTASGTPGEPIVNLISREFPKSLREIVFTRSHVNLWDSPIELAEKKYLNVVGLEWLNSAKGIPNICLIHFEVKNAQADIETVTNFIEAITRTWRKESQQLLEDLFIEQGLIHPEISQGLAIIGFEQNVLGSATETRGHIITYAKNENEPKLIHAYGSHVLAIIALQQFSLDSLNAIWPKDISNKKELIQFSKNFLEFRHNFNWSSLFINSDARKMYRNFRDSLSIEKKYADFGVEINEAMMLAQSKSSLVMARVAAVVAISALVPVWLSDVAITRGIGFAGLATTVALVAMTLRS